MYVCAESDDTVHKLRFGPRGLEQVRLVAVGSFPAETEGPHGVSVSPDGKYWFISLAHGFPFGSIHKFDTETDGWLGEVTAGMFPATMSISPATGLLYVVNFDLDGDMEPSTISVVETSTMIEVARVATGIMPHGARMNAQGTRLYSVNMMSDSLVEVDTLKFEVARSLSLLPEAPPGLTTSGPAPDHEDQAAEEDRDDRDPLLSRMSSRVKPTWVTSPTKEERVYVAGNGDNRIYEVDVRKWAVVRALVVGEGMGPYNLDVTHDGRLLVASYKAGAKVGIWDISTGKELTRIQTTRTVPHGVAITDDDRYAFVSLEGVGGEPGTVEVYDLSRRERVDEIDVGKQAGGIVFWRSEP